MVLLIIGVTVGAWCVVAAGWSVEPPGEEPAGETPALGGPRVVESASDRSLIRRDFSGRVRRTEVPPEEAAIDLLNLDTATRSRVMGIVEARRSILDRVVSEHSDRLLAFQAAGQRDRSRLLDEFRGLLKELEARGPLRDEVASALPDDQARRYHALIEGYWDVVLEDMVHGAKQRNETITRSAARARELGSILANELRRSLERLIAARARLLEEALGSLGLDPEREGKVRRMIAEFAERYGGQATAAQRRDLALRVFRELSREEQARALRWVLERSPVNPPGGDGDSMSGPVGPGPMMSKPD